MSENPWLQYIKLYRKEHPNLSYKDAMKKAAVSYRKLKTKKVGGGKKCEGCKYDSPSQRDHMGPGGCLAENSNSNSNSNSNNNSKHKHNSNNSKSKRQCEGCKYNSPDQRSHMGPGGCLEEDD